MRASIGAGGRWTQTKATGDRGILGLVSLALFVVVWTLVAWVASSPYLPAPAKVLVALGGSLVEKDFLGFYISQHVLASLGRIGYGFLLAAALGIPLGLLLGWSRFLKRITAPVFDIIRPIPPMAWIPFAIYFFGEPFDAVFIVFLAVLFPILLNTIAGVEAVDPIVIDAARTLGARGRTLFLKVLMPASIGNIVTGIRIGLGVGWMSIIAAEMVGVTGGGLGFYIWTMGEIGRFDLVFSGMILIGVIGLAMMKTMSYVEKRFWRGSVKD